MSRCPAESKRFYVELMSKSTTRPMFCYRAALSDLPDRSRFFSALDGAFPMVSMIYALWLVFSGDGIMMHTGGVVGVMVFIMLITLALFHNWMSHYVSAQGRKSALSLSSAYVRLSNLYTAQGGTLTEADVSEPGEAHDATLWFLSQVYLNLKKVDTMVWWVLLGLAFSVATLLLTALGAFMGMSDDLVFAAAIGSLSVFIDNMMHYRFFVKPWKPVLNVVSSDMSALLTKAYGPLVLRFGSDKPLGQGEVAFRTLDIEAEKVFP